MPRLWFAQVGHPNHRGKLSMHLGSIALARSANSWGCVSNQDTDLGFLVHANGGNHLPECAAAAT